jgi:uncharacterized protein (DUF362 family)/NAD-dependent dihydropyrimidine dehydrogenase PreA subunit
MNSQVSIVKCKNYEPALVLQATKQAIELIGGISGFIRPKSKVLVKPNLLVAKEPEFGITTHPEVVRSVIKILKEIDCSVYLGDGPSVWGNQAENIDEVYEKTGMKLIARQEDIELVRFDKRRWRGKFPLTTWLDSCDYFVSIPKLKTHDLTILTGAVKNLFGLVSGTYKTELHKRYFAKEDFAKILVDIYAEAKPALSVVDGIVAMEGDGPGTSGKLRNLSLLLAGADGVALDSILALIMGLESDDILSTKEAAKRRLGQADINSISVLGERLEDAKAEPFLLPTTSIKKKLPRPVIELAKKLIKYYPRVEQDNCTRCAACIEICPNKAISMNNNRIVFDYSKCIACFCCQEACLSSAIKVKKSLLAKMVGL